MGKLLRTKPNDMKLSFLETYALAQRCLGMSQAVVDGTLTDDGRFVVFVFCFLFGVFCWLLCLEGCFVVDSIHCRSRKNWTFCF